MTDSGKMSLGVILATYTFSVCMHHPAANGCSQIGNLLQSLSLSFACCRAYQEDLRRIIYVQAVARKHLARTRYSSFHASLQQNIGAQAVDGLAMQRYFHIAWASLWRGGRGGLRVGQDGVQ